MLTHPRVLAILPHVIPSTILHILKPFAALHRAGQITVEFALEYAVSPGQIAHADVVVFCRNSDPACGAALRAALQLGKPVIYDLDDNFFAMPAVSRAEQNYASPERLQELEFYLRSSGLVRVYSERLRQRVARLNPNVVRVAGPLDWTLVPDHVERVPGRVSIVYATGRVGDELANLFLDDLERVLSAFPGRVQLSLWGFRSKRLAGHPAVRVLRAVTDYDRFFRKFAGSGFDIGLAPLPADEFHLSKSDIKFREYAACRIAGIYSDVSVYDGVRHGITGLRVSDKRGAWFEAVARLVEDDALRHSIQEQAYAYARETYGQDKFAGVWLAQIQSVMCEAPSAAPSRSEFVSSPVRGTGRANVARHLFRLTYRFAKSLRVNGPAQTLARARWTLNDLSILTWRRARHG